MIKRLGTFANFLPSAVGSIRSGEIERDEVLGVIRSAWEDIIIAADEHNDPGNFTTFVAYEYTASTQDMGNLHRNVIFKGTLMTWTGSFSRKSRNWSPRYRSMFATYSGIAVSGCGRC